MIKTREDFIKEIGDMNTVAIVDKYFEYSKNLFKNKLVYLKIRKSMVPELQDYDLNVGVDDQVFMDDNAGMIISSYIDTLVGVPESIGTDIFPALSRSRKGVGYEWVV